MVADLDPAALLTAGVWGAQLDGAVSDAADLSAEAMLSGSSWGM